MAWSTTTFECETMQGTDLLRIRACSPREAAVVAEASGPDGDSRSGGSGGPLPNFTLRQLEYFQAAALYGSISLAAERTLVSRSALAAAISDLEAILGFQLFVRRKSRGVTLTPVGTRLYEMGTDVLESAERIHAWIRGEELSGSLRIGTFASLGPTVLPPLFAYFRKNHPRVRIEFVSGKSEELYAQIADGRIELAVGFGLENSELVDTGELYSERMHALLPASHKLAASSKVQASDLANESLVLLDASPGPTNVRNYFASLGLAPRPEMSFPDFEVVRSMVGRGFGYSLVLQRQEAEVSYEGLEVVARDLEPAPGLTSVFSAWHSRRTLSPPARVARTYLSSTFGPGKVPAENSE